MVCIVRCSRITIASNIYTQLERSEFEATEMIGIAQGLRHDYSLVVP